MRNRTGAIPGLIVMALLSLIPMRGWSLELATVLENAAVTPPSRIAFKEQRHNKLLKEPIILSGYLEYIKAGQLRKVVETPFEESFLITDDYIEIERDGKTRRLSLNRSKPVRAMLVGIEAILAGQVDKLSSIFRYELSGTSCEWSLRLEPLSRDVSTHLAAMLVEGDENSANSIRLELKDGEWSLMEFLDSGSTP